MELFDIMKLIFTRDEKKWKSVTVNDKNRNFFMINRLIAIQFPLQANQFNKLKIEPSVIVDWWHSILSNRFSKPPSWLYTKTEKKEKTSKKTDDKNKILEETEKFICDIYKVSMRDLKTIKKFYPDKYNKWAIDIQKQLEQKI